MRFSVYDIVLIPMLAALAFASKLVLAPVANVELVSVLLCVYTVVLGLKRGFTIALIFTTITVFESSYYGTGTWIIMYYINWPVLSLLSALFLSKKSSEWRVAVLLGLYGLFFDTTGVIIQWMMLGPGGALAYLISGIPFSIMHGAANFVIGLFLFKPLKEAMSAAAKHVLSKE